MSAIRWTSPTWPLMTTGLAGTTDEACLGGALGGTRTPNCEVTDQNKRAMAFRSLKSQASAGRGSHGRKHGQGFGQGYGPESWFSNSWRALGMETRREVDDVRDR